MIAIADAGDHIFDSGVLIQSESFCGNTWFQVAEFAAQEIAGLMYQFQNFSTQADSYLWEFGDGAVSVEETPTHVYAEPGEYEVSLTCTNECFDTTTTVVLNAGTVTGIEDAVEIESTVSNVGQEGLLVKCSLNSSANIDFHIVDALGRTVWSEPVGTTNRVTRTLDISELKKGMYFLRIDAGRSTSIKRFVRF